MLWNKAEQWLLELQRYRAASEPVDDSTFIRFVATFLHDAASRWFSQLCAEEETKPDTWKKFEDAFRQRFRPIDDERSARNQLLQIKQEKGQSIASYSDRFLMLINAVPDMNIKDQIAIYTRGLIPHIGQEVDKNYDNLSTLNTVIAAAHQIETRITTYRSMNTHSSSHPSSFAPGNAPRGAQTGNFRSNSNSWFARGSYAGNPISINRGGQATVDPNRMDLSQMQHIDTDAGVSYYTGTQMNSNMMQMQQVAPNFAPNNMEGQMSYPVQGYQFQHPSQNNPQYLAAMHTQSRPTSYPARPMMNQSGFGFQSHGLTRQEFDQLSREGKCFNCKQAGHLSRNCPKLRQHSLN